jgi:class 3 adenylate cyclase
MGVKVARALLRAPAQPRTAIPEPDERGVVKWRRALLEVASSPGLEQVWQESGIAAIWSTTSALATTETMPQPIAEAGRRPRPYRLSSDHEIRWLTPPKEPLPYLVSPAAVWINYTGTGPVPGLGDALGVSERCAAWPERLWRRFPDVLLGLVVCSRHTRISYADALQAPPSSFDGKAILVGYDLVPGDPFPTPLSLSNRLDRSEVVAQAVQTIADGRYIEETPAAVNVALAGLLGLSGALLVAFLRPLRGSIAGIVLLMLCLAAMTSLFRSVALLMSWVAPSALLSSGVLVGGYQYVREERDRRRIADLFGRYVPRAVVDNVLERSEAQSRALGGVTRDVTVLFADIRGFTAFSEHLPPQEVLTRLNQLLQIMVTCAFKYQGTVDKYIGDAIMVLYNAPLDQADHAERAVRTAMDMQRELATQGGDLGFGIGIHCGEAVVGTVGTPERMEYTAIGATVNLASRLCDTAKQGEVIVSEEVRACLGNRIVAEERAPIRVKNIDRDLQTYVVVQLTDTIDPARPAP